MNAARGFSRRDNAAQRLRSYRARLELLEQRLPPGDAWLGSLLGSFLLAGPGLFPSGLHDLEQPRPYRHSGSSLIANSESAHGVLTFSPSSHQTRGDRAGQGTALSAPAATVQSAQAFVWDSLGGRGPAKPLRAPEALGVTGAGQGGAGGAAVAVSGVSPVSINYTVWTADTGEDAARHMDSAVQTLSTRRDEAAAPAEVSPPIPAAEAKDVGPAQEPEFFQHMTQDMRDNHGKYDNAYTALYEAWLAGEPYEQGEGPSTREYGADVRMSNTAFAGNQNEFQIDINPVDTRFAIGTSNDGRTAGVGIYRTTDGGQTWTAQDAPIGTAACCDPAVAYGSDGVVYVGILDTSPSGQITLRSTDNGETWQQRTFAPLPDRNNLAVDPRDSNIVYITYSDLAGGGNRIKGYRSADGGLTWGSSFFIGTPWPSSGYQQSSQPRVASDGTLYVGYQQYPNSSGGCNAGVQNVVAKSSDGGQNWSHFTWDIRQGGACTTAQVGRGIFCINASSSFRSRSHPILSVHPTNPQIVYLVYSGGDLDTPYTCAGANGFHGDTLFRKSTDGGVTFSDAIRINTDAPGSDQYYPWMDVAPNGRVWVGWNDRRNDPQNFRSRWYQAYSDDQGETWTEEMVADGDTQPSTFIGDYHGLAAENDRVLGMWFDSRSTASGDPYTDPNFQFGLAVANSVPARNEIVTTRLTEFVLTLTDPYNPASVDASDLTVNAIPATSVQQTNPTTLTFQFASSPITQEGTQAMSVAAGAILRLGDDNPILPFDIGFRYDSIRLIVTSTDPAVGSRVDLPFTSLRVNLNEPYDPASVGINDLTLSQGTVTAATPVGPQAIEYTLNGITVEGVLTARIAAGALTDLFGNPSVAFEGTYTTDISAVEFAPFVSRGAQGSLVYESTANGLLAPSDDYDFFYALIDPHQTLSVAATPTTPGGLWPYIALYALPPGDAVFLGDAWSGGPNQSAVLQPVSTINTPPDPIYYGVLVAGLDNTTGGYQLRLTLNAAAEAEPFGGPTNNTPATAQNLDAAFRDLVPGRTGPSRATVTGRADFSAGPLPDEVEPNGSLATANVAVGNFGPHTGNLFQLGVKGAVTPGADVDWIRLGALDAGDVISISLSGTGALRGTLANAIVELYRGPDTAPILVATDDNSGPASDALIWRLQVTTSDTYYVRGRSVSTTATGTYDMGIYLENTGAEPLTGGTLTQEVEPNNTAPTATDFSDSWRRVQHEAQTRGAVNPTSDNDFFQFQFTAGDLVSVHIAATGGTVNARVNLLNATGTIIARDDGTSVNASFRDSPVHAFIIPTTGTYFLQIFGTGTGTYTATTYLSAVTPPPAPMLGYDYYSFTLAAGDTMTLALLGLPSIVPHVEITDAGGNVLAAGERTATNFTEGVANFVAPAAGTYFARVWGGLNLDYNLGLWRNANFDAENNDGFPMAQPLTSRRVGNRQWVAGYVSTGTPDWDLYRVTMAEGGVLNLATTTPGGQEGVFVNAFDPLLIVYDAGGNPVAADDNGGADGRNAVLSYAIPPGGAGTYFIQVIPSFQTPTFTLGEYVLELEGAAGAAPSTGGVGAAGGSEASRALAAVAATLTGSGQRQASVPVVAGPDSETPSVITVQVGDDRPLTAVQVDRLFSSLAESTDEGFSAVLVCEYEL